jgi:hypothetical protein
MSFAEIILRIGGSIGGWLIFLGLCLTLAVIPEADCDPNSDELWRGTLFFALLAGVGLFFVGRGLAWSAALRWFAMPAGVLALYAGYGILPAFGATSLGGASLCAIANPTVSSLSGYDASSLERVWPVVQIAVLAGGIGQAFRYWNAAKAPSQG